MELEKNVYSDSDEGDISLPLPPDGVKFCSKYCIIKADVSGGQIVRRPVTGFPSPWVYPLPPSQRVFPPPLSSALPNVCPLSPPGRNPPTLLIRLMLSLAPLLSAHGFVEAD